mgnify:CR=1 FL=1
MARTLQAAYHSRMFGYLLMALAVVILLPLIFFLMGRGRGPRPQGKTKVGAHPPVARSEPAADEPTPDVSTPRDRDGESRVPPA